MTSNRAAKRHVDAPDVHCYGWWPNRIRRWRRALARPVDLSELAYMSPVPGRLLAASKVGRRSKWMR